MVLDVLAVHMDYSDKKLCKLFSMLVSVISFMVFDKLVPICFYTLYYVNMWVWVCTRLCVVGMCVCVFMCRRVVKGALMSADAIHAF